MGKIYEIFGDDAHAMTMALMEAADIASAIDEGASIGLKPNLVLAGTPESGATTHPGVFAAGDVVTGAKTVVHAVEAAKSAEQAMMRYMEQGIELPSV